MILGATYAGGDVRARLAQRLKMEKQLQQKEWNYIDYGIVKVNVEEREKVSQIWIIRRRFTAFLKSLCSSSSFLFLSRSPPLMFIVSEAYILNHAFERPLTCQEQNHLKNLSTFYLYKINDHHCLPFTKLGTTSHLWQSQFRE